MKVCRDPRLAAIDLSLRLTQGGAIPVHRGFTVLEILVVIGIISVLLALLGPAVQRARETARTVQCRNNMKMLGLACLNFHDTYGFYPRNTVRPRGTTQVGAEPPGNLWNWNSGTYESWCRELLPFVESNGMRVQDAVPILGCPSDPRGTSYRVSDYGFTWYVGLYSNPNTVNNGMIVDDSNLKTSFTVSSKAVTDGTSHTILLAERPPPADGQRGWWDSRCCMEDTMSPALGNNKFYSNGTNGKCPNPALYQRGNPPNNCYFHAPWSNHDGGGNFCMGDGSVRMINYDVGDSFVSGSTLLEALASRAGNEATSDNW